MQRISLKVFFIIILMLSSVMGVARSLQLSQITGSDELFNADVIRENDQNKLVVKATNAPQSLGDLFFLFAENGGSNSMSVNGSVTQVIFEVPADATQDLIVSSLIFEAFAGGIKIDKFLSLNSELTNGILIEVKSEDVVFQFLSIKNTTEFNAHFANGAGRSFDLVFASGNDSMVARFSRASPFILKKQGTFGTNDYIRVIIRDNLTSINSLMFIATGTKE
jgi:hypothetical protein